MVKLVLAVSPVLWEVPVSVMWTQSQVAQFVLWRAPVLAKPLGVMVKATAETGLLGGRTNLVLP